MIDHSIGYYNTSIGIYPLHLTLPHRPQPVDVSQSKPTERCKISEEQIGLGSGLLWGRCVVAGRCSHVVLLNQHPEPIILCLLSQKFQVNFTNATGCPRPWYNSFIHFAKS